MSASTPVADDALDKAGPPRESERLPKAALEAWLSEHLDSFLGRLETKQFRKGHSNLTYEISDGSREWVLRRGPFGSNVATAHDMGREYRILSGLHRAYPPAPRAWVMCEELDVIGAPFYVMERKRGVILRNKPPVGLTWTPELGDATSRAFIENLVAIHDVDLAAAGLHDFGRPEGYVQRQVEGWTKRYFGSQTDEIPEIVAAAEWLAAKMPAEVAGTLIHNDCKYDNLVLDAQDMPRIVGVLDWEMATVGDPLMDLGTALSYWMTADDVPEVLMMPFGVAHFPGSWSRERLVSTYGELSGRDVHAVDFYHVFGLFKTAVVAQQIYYRFKTGKTDDPRFQVMITGVHVLSKFAASIIERSKL